MSSNSVTHSNSPTWLGAFSRQATRRVLVGAWAACCLAVLALGIFEIKGVIWFIVLALTLATDVLLFVATHRVTDRPTSSLDEREQTVRNRAYRTAYGAVFLSITVIVAGAMILFFTGNQPASGWLAHPASHPALVSALGVATLQIVSLLPTAIIAWTERDEPDDAA